MLVPGSDLESKLERSMVIIQSGQQLFHTHQILTRSFIFLLIHHISSRTPELLFAKATTSFYLKPL
jgi:hypothetical protein